MRRRVGDAYVAGTRGSALAMWQTEHVLELLRRHRPEVQWDYRVYSTHGDSDSVSPLAELGGRGAFTERLEAAMAAGEIDLAVHSLKDLPTEASEGILVAAVVGPRNSGEVLISQDGKRLAELPRGAIVGTSSLRRRAQLLRLRPDLEIRDIRGNVETRIAKVRRGEYAATVLAAAGVERLGLQQEIAEALSTEELLPAPGQGAIAVQCRSDAERLIELLQAIDDPELHACVTAERGFLEALGGGCSAPIGALALPVAGSTSYTLRARVTAPDGGRVLDGEESGSDASALGRRLAARLQKQGARELLGLSGRANELPLADRRIVVTRRREQSARLVELLEEAGAEVVLLPTIAVYGLPRDSTAGGVLDRLGQFDWIIFTSRNAVEQFVEVRGTGGKESAPAGPRLAAVGPATEESLRAAGLQPDFVARGETAKALAEELPVDPGMKVLYPCAQRHGSELEEILSRRQAQVECLPIYRTAPLPVGEEGLRELSKGVDWVLFTSGSTVEGFLASFEEASPSLHPGLERARFACIGPSTARVAEERGIEAAVVAEEHTASGLVSAVIRATLEERI